MRRGGLPTAVALLALLAGLPAVARQQGPRAELPNRVLIRNVRVFDGKSETLSGGMSLLVEGGKIAQVSAGSIAPPAGATVIDGGGRVLMPGLVDAHTHVLLRVPLSQLMTSSPWYVAISAADGLEKMLLRGFTTIRDMGGADGSFALAVDRGLVAGPRIFPSGSALSQTAGHGDFRLPYATPPMLDGKTAYRSLQGFAFVLDGVPGMLAGARENLRNGATQIKIMGGGGVASNFDPLSTVQFTPEEVRAAVQVAADWGTYVVAHTYSPPAIKMLIENGVKQIAHGHLLDEETMKLAADKGVIVETELIPFWQHVWFGKEFGDTEEILAKNKAVMDRFDNFFALLKKYRIRVVFGTDLLGPAQDLQNREFALRAKYFTPAEILRQATSHAYEAINMCGPLNRYGKFGVIEAGALADLLIVGGNPLEKIEILEDPEKNLVLIMKDGKIHKNRLQ